MEQLAQGLASLGRNGDSMLVHMTPKEVQGLQQLALAKGGSLTVNPHTGLPEAFDLGDIFEFAAPIVGGIIGGPIGAGLAGGLTSYARHGDLGKAALSGAMGWGLGSLGEGLEKAGESALSSEWLAKTKALEDASQLGGLTATEVAKPMMPAPETEWVRVEYPEAGEPQFFQQTAPQPTANIAPSPIPKINPLPEITPMQPASYFDKVIKGAQTVDPLAFIKENKLPIAAAGLGAFGMLAPKSTAPTGSQAKTGYAPQYSFQQAQYDANGRLITPASYSPLAPTPYTYYAANGGSVPNTFPQSNIEQMAYSKSLANPTPTNVVGIPSSDYDARINQQGDVFTAAAGAYVPKSKTTSTEVYKETFDPESAKEDADLMALIAKLSRNPATQYAAQGGTIKMADGGLPGIFGMLQQAGLFGPQQQEPVKYDYDPNRQYYTKLNSGGVASLGGEYAAGGKLLQGPGDGMSDSIPAVIKGAKPQRAALAQGEFVVPADVVSHLGNGSTDAGAKRLYAMMDKVRQARTGTKKQGRQINPERFMPA